MSLDDNEGENIVSQTQQEVGGTGASRKITDLRGMARAGVLTLPTSSIHPLTSNHSAASTLRTNVCIGTLGSKSPRKDECISNGEECPLSADWQVGIFTSGSQGETEMANVVIESDEEDEGTSGSTENTLPAGWVTLGRNSMENKGGPGYAMVTSNESSGGGSLGRPRIAAMLVRESG